jgi:hypothetical protein
MGVPGIAKLHLIAPVIVLVGDLETILIESLGHGEIGPNGAHLETHQGPMHLAEVPNQGSKLRQVTSGKLISAILIGLEIHDPKFYQTF